MTQLLKPNRHAKRVKISAKLGMILASCLLASSCTAASIPADSPEHEANHSDVSNNDAVAQNKETQVLQQAKQIKDDLATGNYEALTPYIHPVKGVRFSMYAYIHKNADKVFRREQFTTYLQQSRVKFTWGAKDGTGDLYITTLPSFLDHWVAAQQYDFKDATFNQFQGSGNSLNNLKEVYPNADFVEFYHSGKNPEYQGMDWRAMRLVFEEYQGKSYLVAIVNDQWTV